MHRSLIDGFTLSEMFDDKSSTRKSDKGSTAQPGAPLEGGGA